ncbi:hypothetical protein SDC9_113151 [bioreactor metagenome]|uniref:Uncharacterized protein n=1 Tax=bioreactor metagenome TaxID=1076179 RepID=A0A645BWW9_9ZZZZ
MLVPLELRLAGLDGERSARLLRCEFEKREPHADLSRRSRRGKGVCGRRHKFRAHADAVIRDGYRQPVLLPLQRNGQPLCLRLDGVLRNVEDIERKLLHTCPPLCPPDR